MLPELRHSNHSNKWMVPSLSCSNTDTCRDTDTCISCLLDVLRNSSLSQVQRQMSLDILSCLMKNSVITLELLSANQDISFYILNLITVCAELVHRLQDENLYELLLDKFQRAVLDMSNETRTQFFLLVFNQLCNVSLVYANILLSSQTETIRYLLNDQELVDMDIASSLVCILTHIIKALSSNHQQLLVETNSLVWKIMVSLVFWLNTADNSSFQTNCLALLKECLQLEDVPSGLLLVGQGSQSSHSLLVGQGSQSSHSLLMGLKRILLTKDELLVFASTQCLTTLIESLKGTEHIREVFDTDLAAACFTACTPWLATSYSLRSVTQYMDGESGGSDCFNIVVQLLGWQPECMPLFVSVSWSKCFRLLNACLQNRKLNLFLAALKATKAFLRTQHQQSPVDVASVATLVRTCLVQCDHHLKVLSEHDHNQQQSTSLVSLLMDVVLSSFRLVSGDCVLCGNMEEQIQELKSAIRNISAKLVLPWILEHWHYLSNSSRIEKFLACLDVLVSADAQGQQAAELAHVVAVGLPCRILSLSLQPGISEETRRLTGHILAGLFLQLAKYLRPCLQLNEDVLISGFSRLTWHEAQQGRKAAERISSKEEAVAWFCLAYFSCLMAYRLWTLLDIHAFIERILQRYPDLLSYDRIVARAFVYLQAICQTSDVDEDSVWCRETECALVNHLSKCAVDLWLTEDPIVFRWSMLTETRASSVGAMLIEYWLLQLTAGCSPALQIDRIAGDKREVLLEMRHNYNFLHCLVVLLDSQSVARPARDILIYGISSLPESSTYSYHVSMCDNLFMEVIQKFEALFVQTAELNALVLVNMVPVLCELLESPLLSAAMTTSSFKSVYHAVKLVGIAGLEECALAWSLKYLACVTRGMPVQDSRAVIPALMKDDKLLETLEDSVASLDTAVSAPALSLVAWLASTDHLYQASRPIVVSSDFLLSSLASSRYATSLHVLKLLNAALSAPAAPRCVHVVKRQQNFESTKVFSPQELKQVYLYMQQFIVKEDAGLRTEAVECMKTLLNTNDEIRWHAQSQPWNSLMLESVLSARTQTGLTDSDLDLCLLFLPNGDQMWMGSAGNSFLLAVLSGVSKSQLDRATTIFRHIKQLPGAVDPEVLASAEEYLRQQSATAP